MPNIKERLDEIKNIIEKDAFYASSSLGGELNFHIFDYEPQDELKVRDYVRTLLDSYSHENSKVKPIEFDLFELILEILKEEKIGNNLLLDKAIEIEATSGTDRLIKALSPIFKPENITKIIKSKISNQNLVLLTGVGKAYPLLRSHTILNNLHSVLDNMPVIMFYPGSYDQKELSLFKSDIFEGIRDDNYYRAFRLVGNI